MENSKTSDVINTILERRSIRAFLPEPIPREHLDQLIESLHWAPSAGNRQPWHFYMILNPEIKRFLAVAAFDQDFVAQAPVVFVVCAIPEKSAARYGQRGRELYVYQDTAAAVQNLLLASVALGYGTCWVGAFDESEVSRALKIEKHMRPVAIIPVGKPGKKPAPTRRSPLAEILTILE